MQVDCLICIESIDAPSQVWQCTQCFMLFHLSCIQAHARTAIKTTGATLLTALGLSDGKWSCPHCRKAFTGAEYPSFSTCFCGKVRDPTLDPWLPPHCCGNTCSRLRPCGHACTEQCHAGQCSKCPQMTTLQCFCHKSTKMGRCGAPEYSCGQVCGKMGAARGDSTADVYLKKCTHNCTEMCHDGPCPPCDALVTAACRCGNNTKKTACKDADWNCGTVCGKVLQCGRHSCTETCHDGPCQPCALFNNRMCPCGMVKYGDLPCHEMPPSCGNTCGKLLNCKIHTCERLCHKGQCDDCVIMVEQACRCGKTMKARVCAAGEFLCQGRCPALRNCGRHQCRQRCCIGPLTSGCAPCTEVCGKKLSCGNHSCRAFCHDGPCHPCVNTVALECPCKKCRVVVPCGNPRKLQLPPCVLPCSHARECGHTEADGHRCHAGPCPPCLSNCAKKLIPCGHECASVCHKGGCPPCSTQVERFCLGQHERRLQACSAPSLFTCAQRCGACLPCGRHACERTCHTASAEACGNCGETCSLPRACTHPCSRNLCHPGECPPCGVPVTQCCFCGKHQQRVACADKRVGMFSCGEKCAQPLPTCQHVCGAVCHDGECSKVYTCRKPIVLRCRCGKLSKSIECHDAAKYVKRPAAGHPAGVKVLECDASCASSESPGTPVQRCESLAAPQPPKCDPSQIVDKVDKLELRRRRKAEEVRRISAALEEEKAARLASANRRQRLQMLSYVVLAATAIAVIAFLIRASAA